MSRKGVPQEECQKLLDEEGEWEGGRLMDAPPEYTATEQPRVVRVLPADAHNKGHMVYIADDGSLPPEPDNYLCLAIFSIICCCIPCGIVALVMSLMVGQRYARGDYLGARKAAQYAKIWALASILCGLVTVTLYMFTLWQAQMTLHHVMAAQQLQNYTYQ